MKPRLLNTWPERPITYGGDYGGDTVSILCFESTVPITQVDMGLPQLAVLPARVPPNTPVASQGESSLPAPGSDYEQVIVFRNMGLAMAEDEILVADGLIRKYSVERGCAAGEDFVLIRVVTEHPVTAVQVPGTSWGFAGNCLPGSERMHADGLSKSTAHPADHSYAPVEGPPFKTAFSFSRGPLHRLFAGKLVALDPGHGGKDTGIRGPVNLLEKDISMQIAAEAQTLLRASGALPFLTREKDEPLNDHGRAQVVLRRKAEFCVQIHASGGRSPLSRKYHVYAKPGCTESQALAGQVAFALRERIGMAIPEVEYLEELSLYEVPTIRVEPLCLSHFVDEANFRAPLFRKRIAQAIYNGLARHLAEIPSEPRTQPDPTPPSPSVCSLLLSAREKSPLTTVDPWEKPAVLRIRTHLITEKDDPVGVVKTYTKDIADKTDIVGIAESVVAIMQGRAIDPDTVQPSFLARLVSRFAHPDASVSAPRSMQMAIEEVGSLRILIAAAAGLWGKITRRRGLFFKVAGHQVAEIDDSGGTMPPYDRSIIMGPKDPNQVARIIRRQTGLWTLILDVNDKGCVDVLGSSIPLSKERENTLKSLLKTNPFGNDDQKTPLVIIKPSYTPPQLHL